MEPSGHNLPYWFAVLLVMVPLTIVAAYIDGAYRRVPNWSTFGLALLGFIANIIFAATGHGGLGLTWYGSLGWSVLGWFIGLLPLFLVWFIRGMGAGDVKLIAGMGAWLGGQLVLVVYVVGLLLGGVMAVLIILLCGKGRTFLASFAVLKEKMLSRDKIGSEFGSARSLAAHSQIPLLPYGVPLTIGMLFVLVCHLFGAGEARTWYEGFFQDIHWSI
jgi:prepilin peptidase CpaA